MQRVVGPCENERHAEIFEDKGHEHAALNILPDNDRRPVEMLEPEVTQDWRLGGVRRDQVNVGQLYGEVLDQVLIAIDTQNVVP